MAELNSTLVKGNLRVTSDIQANGFIYVDGKKTLQEASASRPGVTKLYRKDDDSGYYVATAWTGAYWLLSGFNANGTDHAGCQVAYANSAGSAGSVAWANVSDKPLFATVATSGSYNDLSNKPTIPTVGNATLTIQRNGTTVQTFTANASTDVTCNITVPTNTNQLTNGAGFINTEDLEALLSDDIFVTEIKKNSNNSEPYSGNISFWVGNQSQYNSLATKRSSVIYIIT